jgi:Alpha/beta hydrolase domain
MIPLYDSAIHHLHSWLNGGPPPPIQPRISFAGDPPEIVRDEHGLAVGGVRLPQVEVPVAQNSAIPLSNDIHSRLGGSCVRPSHPRRSPRSTATRTPT